MRGSIASTLTAVGCTLIVGAAVGVGVAYALFSSNTPESLQTEAPLSSVHVTMQEFDDPRSVELAAEILPPANIVPNRAGTVTAWACSQGAALTSGTSAIAVDGVNLLNLSTSVPLWRDLAPGDKGTDVKALEEELVRLGQPANVDAVLSRAEMKTLTELAKGAGVALDGALARDLTVWLPGPSVSVEQCEKQLGAPIAAGDIVATVDSGVVVSAVALPEDRLPGERYLDLLSEPVALSDAGELPPEVTSTAIRGTNAFREAASASPEATSVILKGKVRLQTPVKVAAIPATAILVDSAGTACVFVDDEPLAVTVVGSEFGNSFVVFSSEASPDSVDAKPGTRPSCT